MDGLVLTVKASIVLLAVNALAVAALAGVSEKPWMQEVKVTLGEPVIVAQAEQAKLNWGEFQFPSLSQPDPNYLLVNFNTNEDRPHERLADFRPPGRMISMDGGKTWQATDVKYGFASLYAPVMLCHRRNGDVIYVRPGDRKEVQKSELPQVISVFRAWYFVRDPLEFGPDMMPESFLMVKHPGSKEWDQTPTRIDDPNAAITTFDPEGKDYSQITATRVTQVLELRDGSLLGLRLGLQLTADRKPKSQWSTWCIRSTDEGKTWKYLSDVASDYDGSTQCGYNEHSVTVMPDGSLLAVMRTEGGMEVDQRTGILSAAQSYDLGRTWSKPRAVNPFGVFPQILTLKNGITVLSFGRPGVNLLFNVDGRGERWEGLHLLVNEGTRFTRTSGYTSLIATGPNSFMIAYDQFDYPNAKGEPRKTIFVRNIVVEKTRGGK